MSRQDEFVIALVGCGPRGTGVLERILANVPEILPGTPVGIDVVDPFPPGAGRVWRDDQSPLMWMNAMAENVTMFTDETVRCDGPIRPGPSLSEWAACVSDDDECGTLSGLGFASRRLQGRYLGHVFHQVVAGRPANVTVTVHPTLAVRLEDGPGGRQLVWLEHRREPLVADVVILTIGHVAAHPDPIERSLLDFAARHGLRYLPRAYSVDADLNRFRPGESVVMRGFGLAAIDLIVLLTEARGGRYVESDGRLVYQPCGAEPTLYLGSRRGVPYRAKFTYRLGRDMAPLPRFFEASAIVDRYRGGPAVDFRTDLWPLIAKEVGWGYYHELFVGHPERVVGDWAEFAAAYERLDWYSEQMRELVDTSVPKPADRLDFESFDRPLAGLRFAGFGDLQSFVYQHIRDDVERRADPAFSADLAAFFALLSTYGQMAPIVAGGLINGRSYVADVGGWWQGFFEYFGSGPPNIRNRQLLALADAGVVRFLGADMFVAADEEHGVFRAGSVSVPRTVTATGLIEARLPSPDVADCPDPLLRHLYTTGAASEYAVPDERDGFRYPTGLLHVSPVDFRVIDRSGNPHPDRYALGPYTNVTYFGTFARPRVNALSFRQNDALARTVLSRHPSRRR